MVLTAHFIDSNWKLHKMIFTFNVIENYKGYTIGKNVEKNLKSWGIEKVMTLTIDNVNSNDIVVVHILTGLFGALRVSMSMFRM